MKCGAFDYGPDGKMTSPCQMKRGHDGPCSYEQRDEEWPALTVEQLAAGPPRLVSASPQPLAGSFRKRPVVVQAMRFYQNVKPWPDGVVERLNGNVRDAVIETLEGDMLVTEGDWVITGVKGERYPCKPDIFDLTYEPVTFGVYERGRERDQPKEESCGERSTSSGSAASSPSATGTPTPQSPLTTVSSTPNASVAWVNKTNKSLLDQTPEELASGWEEDPGTCVRCGEPFELVRPGKSQPTCRCWEEPTAPIASPTRESVLLDAVRAMTPEQRLAYISCATPIIHDAVVTTTSGTELAGGGKWPENRDPSPVHVAPLGGGQSEPLADRLPGESASLGVTPSSRLARKGDDDV